MQCYFKLHIFNYFINLNFYKTKLNSRKIKNHLNLSRFQKQLENEKAKKKGG